MSDMYRKFQIPTSNTVERVAETQTKLQSVTEGCTYRRTVKGKTIYAHSLFVAGAKSFL